ncbi:hypothetical protein SUGI_0534000 [Cryptomeria japonica]|nr:hypothetical protein SUGI_0534000 [Cryptomeria japonica]
MQKKINNMWDSGQKLKRKKIEEKKVVEGEDKNDAEEENVEEEQDDDGKQEDCNRKASSDFFILISSDLLHQQWFLEWTKYALKYGNPGIRAPLPQEQMKWQVVKPSRARRATIENPPRVANGRECDQGVSSFLIYPEFFRGILDLDPASTPILPPSQLRSSRIPGDAEDIGEEEFIINKGQEECTIPSSPSLWFEALLDLLGVTAELETPLVSKEEPHSASTDAKGGELDALPLLFDQVIRVEDCRNSNAFPHRKECSTNEEKATQDEDVARKEEEVNCIINYLYDSVIEEIMSKMLDEIIDKKELVLQKNLLDKEILSFSPPPMVSDIEELLLDLNNKENETLGIELWAPDKSTLDCAKLFKKRGRKSLSEL